jgi:hypothetical protein
MGIVTVSAMLTNPWFDPGDLTIAQAMFCHLWVTTAG